MEPNDLTRDETSALLYVINQAIAYRLNNKTRMSDIAPLRAAKAKLGLEERLDAFRHEEREAFRREHVTPKRKPTKKRGADV